MCIYSSSSVYILRYYFERWAVVPRELPSFEEFMSSIFGFLSLPVKSLFRLTFFIEDSPRSSMFRVIYFGMNNSAKSSAGISCDSGSTNYAATTRSPNLDTILPCTSTR